MEGDAAFALGNMAALMGDGGGEEEEGEDDEGVAGHMDFMDTMEEMVGKLQRFGKIIIKCVVVGRAARLACFLRACATRVCVRAVRMACGCCACSAQ